MTYKNTIIITGGTSGLGYETALLLARKNPQNLIIVCSRTSHLASERINKTLSQTNTIFLPIDLSSTTSIREFIHTYNTTTPPYPPITTLYLNSGIPSPPTFQTNSAGIELTFATNHLGPSHLYFLLKPHLSPTARIIFTSSSVHDPAQNWPIEHPIYSTAQEIAFLPNDSNLRNGKHNSWYSTSKLCNVLFTYALARRLDDEGKGKGRTVVAFDPGMMTGTGFVGIHTWWFRILAEWVLPVLIPLLRVCVHRNINTAMDSARDLAALAVDGGDEGESGGRYVNGVYFEGTKVVKSSVLSYDIEKQEDLWDWTVRNLNVSKEE